MGARSALDLRHQYRFPLIPGPRRSRLSSPLMSLSPKPQPHHQCSKRNEIIVQSAAFPYACNPLAPGLV